MYNVFYLFYLFLSVINETIKTSEAGITDIIETVKVAP